MIQTDIKVKELIDRIQKEKTFPAILQHVTEITSKAAPTSDSSANELAALILRDYSLTSNLLKVANSAMYSQFSGSISTVSRAVVVLGFEQIQSAAAGLIVFEHLQDNSKSQYTKEAVLSAFLSGILARDLTRNMRINDWENYYLGAMFHNLGRLLVTYYFPEEFDLYLQLVHEQNFDDKAAERKALGVFFADLGIGVAKFWHLPEQIISSMESARDFNLKLEPSRKINHQQLLPRFANELCDITMYVSPKKRRERLIEVLKKYRKIYPVRQNEIISMMDDATKEMQKFAVTLQFDLNDLQRLDRRNFNLSADSRSDEKSAAPELSAAAVLHKFEITDPDQNQLHLTTAEERKLHLQGGIQEIASVMLDDVSLDEILGMILETIYRGIGFDRVVIFFKDPRSDRMLARYGLGAKVAEAISNFSFPLGERGKDLFSLALADNKDLYVGDISAAEIRDLKPAWFSGPIFSPSFAVYPIIVNQRVIGLIYGGHDMAGEQLDREQLNAIKILRNQAALAIKQCHTPSSPG